VQTTSEGDTGLADLTQAATGYGAAVVLSEAGLLEKELAARRP
jgi:hypothetical protein